MNPLLLFLALNLPERLESIGDFRSAAAEYLREGDTASAARALLSLGDTGEALRLLSGSADTPSLILKARIYLSQWRISEAMDLLGSIRASGLADSLRVLARIMLMDFSGAEEESRGDSGLLGVIGFAKETAPLLYSPVSAARLSCLPGLGQFYADEPLEGIWALAVNAVVLGFISYSIYRGYKVDRSYYMDALLAYNFFFNRFYSGAAASAEHTAREKNRALLERWLERIAKEKGFDPIGR